MSDHWFSPSRFGPTGGIITQALAIIGIATIAASFHAAVMPESAIWLEPDEGFSSRQSHDAGLPRPVESEVQVEPASAEPETTDTPALATTPGYGSHITGEQAFELFDAQAADFIDARPAEEYLEGHILGAFSVPIDRSDERVAMLVADGWIAPDRRVVVYCVGGTCTESKLVVRALFEAGFDPAMVHIDDGGFPAWAEAGYPVEVGADVSEELP